ncbi:IS66 family insertion sequence element accessory protein TnpA [Xenorhabdus griffiniae]
MAIIDSQKQSGLTVTAFCQHHEINLATFEPWNVNTSDIM